MPAATGVLFINKTARSGQLTQSQGSEKARIYSHVQRCCQAQAPRSAPEKPDKVLYQLPDSWMMELNQDESSRPSKGQQPQQRSQPEQREEEKTKVAVVGLQARRVFMKSQQLAPLNLLSGGAADPFDSLKARMSPEMEDLFRYYSSDVIPRIFPIKQATNIARVYTLTQAFEDPLQRDSLLCTASAMIYVVSGSNRHAIAAMAFKGRALGSLQRQLSECNGGKAASSPSVYAVALLLYVECIFGNEEDLTAHAKGLSQLVESSGIDTFDSPLCIFATLFACSYLGAALLDVAPDLKPIPMSDDSCLSQAALDALNGFERSEPQGIRLFGKHKDFLGPALLNAALKQRTVIHFRCICVRGWYEPSPAELQYIYGQETSVEYQLTALRADEALSPAQQAVRLVLFIIAQPFNRVTSPKAAFCRSMTKHLKKWLGQSDLVNLWGSRRDLLLWVLFAMAHISIGEAEWPWVSSHLSTLISYMGLQSADEMEEVLFGFYYYAKFFRVTVDKIWVEHRGTISVSRERWDKMNEV